MIYTKKVKQRELDFYIVADNYNITPSILSYTKIDDDYYSLDLVRYPFTLLEIPKEDRKRYVNKIVEKIKELHNIGILWVDIHEENIVIDKEDVKLIDFGPSKWKTEFTTNLGLDWFDAETDTIEEYMKIEIREIDLLCCLVNMFS